MAEQIVFDTGEEQVLFYVLADTRINGVNYLLVSDSEEDEAECYILMDSSREEDAEALYSFVEDDDTLEALAKVFEELLEDTEIE